MNIYMGTKFFIPDSLHILKKNGVSGFPTIPRNLKQCDTLQGISKGSNIIHMYSILGDYFSPKNHTYRYVGEYSIKSYNSLLKLLNFG
jgi:hypothetical protein